METTKNIFDLSEKLDKLIEELSKRNEGKFNITQLFRDNIDKVLKIKNTSLNIGLNGNDMIREFFLSKGYIKSFDDLSNQKIENTLSKIRREHKGVVSQKRSIARKGKKKNQPKAVETIIVFDISDTEFLKQQIIPDTLTFEELTSHKLDWSDYNNWEDKRTFTKEHFSSYANIEDGGKNIKPLKDKDGNYVWSDYWELLYRTILKAVSNTTKKDVMQTSNKGVRAIWPILQETRDKLNIDETNFKYSLKNQQNDISQG